MTASCQLVVCAFPSGRAYHTHLYARRYLSANTAGLAYASAAWASNNLYESSVVPGRLSGATRMDSALLQNLMAGAGSSSQFIGGLIVALLYVVIGLLGAIGSILIFRQIFQGRWEQIFWTSFLVVIAAFYLSFAAYFEASTRAWQTEVVGVAVFLVCAVGGLFLRSAIAVGYVMHGLWDLSHCLSGSSLAGPSKQKFHWVTVSFAQRTILWSRVIS